MVKNLLANAGDARDVGSVSVLGRSPEAGNGNRLRYSCLENSTETEAWQTASPQCSKESDMTERACALNTTDF